MSRSHPPSLVAASVLALALLFGACRRGAADWVGELGSPDPWRQRMASLALGSVEDEQMPLAFRALLVHLRERPPELHDAQMASLAALSRRRPELPRRALEAMPSEQTSKRAEVARLLLGLAREGDAESRAALLAFIEAEERTGLAFRLQVAAELRRGLEGAP